MSERTQRAQERSSQQPSAEAQTTVEVRCTGHIRRIVGDSGFEYEFDGNTLRAFLDAFFRDYDVREKLIAETEAEATTAGWAPSMEDLPGQNYAKNPEGEQTRRYARVTVNGTFNEHLAGLDTQLDDGDRIGLLYPFIYCC